MSAAEDVPLPEITLPIEWLPERGAIEQLVVLLHGWCHDAAAMAPLAQALRAQFPQSAVLVPESAAPSERGRGKRWYSIDGVTDETEWLRRVTALREHVQRWLRAQQARLGVGTAATALGGFSQGAVIALAIAQRHDGIAGRVLAFAGRFVVLPDVRLEHTTLHFFHGGTDAIFPAQHARDALRRIAELHGDATIDIAEEIGHELHPALIDRALHRLRSHVPLRTWQAALGGHAPPPRG